ncbi:unnamed protein product [Rotaria sp. Silwood2]|nr:unnamed protein product [Rotaria sp. Silwood2]
MVSNEHQQKNHPLSNLSLLKSYSSLPPQHPIRFIGLSAQVFFYYLGYGASYRSYLILASLSVATMGLSNHSVGYLNYPTQVMFKCCKLIPVLIGGIIIQKKKFNRYDVAAAFCMSIGLVFFTLADSKVRPNFNSYGVIVICSALVADAIIGNYQEKIMKTHHVSNVEIVFYSFMFGFFIILTGLLLTNNFFSSMVFWNKVLCFI